MTAAGACWYAKSRGEERRKDYGWRPDGPRDRERVAVILACLRARIGTAVNDEDPGLALFHDAALGLVAYLPALRPSALRPDGGPLADSLGREIRAALLGVATTREGQREIGALADAALDGSLDQRLPLEYGSELAAGFDWDPDGWRDLLDRCLLRVDRPAPGQAPGGPPEPLAGDRLEADTDRARQRVAGDLRSLLRDGLPAAMTGRVIALRAPSLGESQYRRLRPWRTLTALPLVEDRERTVPPSAGGGRTPRPIDRRSIITASTAAGAAVVGGVIGALINGGSTPPPAPVPAPSRRPAAPPVPAYQAWTYRANAVMAVAPALAGGIVAIVTTDGTAAGITAAAGRLAWHHSLDAPVLVPPVAAGGVVYLTSADGTLQAVRGTGRSPLWTATTPPGPLAPAESEGTLYLAAADGTVSAVRADTGKVLWTYQTGPRPSGLAVSGGRLYVTAPDGTLDVLTTAKSGRPVATSVATGLRALSAPVVAGGSVYLSTADGGVYAYNAVTRKRAWSTTRLPAGLSAPVVSGDTVYLAGVGGRVCALHAASGAERWTYDTGRPLPSAPAPGGAEVYLSSPDGTITALDAGTGRPAWVRPTGLTGVSAPVPGSGLLYVTSADGTLYAMRAGS